MATPSRTHSPAGALRSHQGFVPRKAQNVNVLGLHVDRQDTGTLRGVHDEQRPPIMDDGADAGNIQRVPRKIGGVGADHRPRTGADAPGKLVIADSALPVRWNKVQRHAPLRLKAVQRPQDGVMLQIR